MFAYHIATVDCIQDLFKSHVTGLNNTLQDATDMFESSCHLFVIVLFCMNVIHLSHKTAITANTSYAQQSSHYISAVVYARKLKLISIIAVLSILLYNPKV